MSKILLSLGITAMILAAVLVAASVRYGNPILRTAAAVYVLMAVAALCYREVRRRTYLIRKRRISRR